MSRTQAIATDASVYFWSNPVTREEATEYAIKMFAREAAEKIRDKGGIEREGEWAALIVLYMAGEVEGGR